MATLVKEAKYIKSDYKNNNNKFWYINIYDDCSVVTEYGRVGKNPQTSTKNFGSMYQAEDFFTKKCQEKERSGRNGEIAYRPLNVVSSGGTVNGSTTVTVKEDLATIAERQIDHDPHTIALIRYLAKVNVHNIVSNTKITYNADSGLFSTPCGIVTASTINDARKLLIQIGSNIESGKTSFDGYGELINDYLMMIPQDIGMKRFDPATLYKGQGDIQKQNDILDSLEASLNSVLSGSVKKTDKPKDNGPEPVLFKTRLVKVIDPKVINAITSKYKSSRLRMHTCYHLNPSNVYEVEIRDMANNFERIKSKINNVKELWHGSSASNLLSIMKNGLIIPPRNSSYCTGRLFGDGVYASETSTKAAGYSYGFWGGQKQNRFFVFLLNMAMGKTYSPRNTYGPFPKQGYDSTYVAPNTCGVKNDEYIVYNVSQVNLKYLVELE